MKKLLMGVLVLCLGYSYTFAALNCEYLNKYSEDEIKVKTSKKDLPCINQTISSYMSTQVPYKIDKFTSIISVKSVDDSLIYNYRIKDLNKDLIPQMKEKMPILVTNANCTDDDTKWIINLGAKIYHKYFDEEGNVLIQFFVEKKMCKN